MSHRTSNVWKLLGGLLAASAVVLLALHVALTRHLTGILRRTALPMVRKALGVDVRVGDATVNLFRGQMAIADVRFANPPSFPGPNFFSTDLMTVDLALPALAGQVADFSAIRVDNARMTVVRNAEGDVNVFVIDESLRRATRRPGADKKQPPAEPTPPTASPDRPARIPKIATGHVRVTARLEYVDYTFPDEPLRLAFDVVIETDGVATVDNAGAPWGRLRITGHLADNPKLYRIDLSGTIAPLTDPGHPTFEGRAKIAEIDGSTLQPLARRLGYTADTLAIELPIRCERGVIDKSVSRLVVKAANPRPVRIKKKSFPLPPELSLSAVLSGPLHKPQCDFLAGLLESGLGNLAGVLRTLADDIDRKPKAPASPDGRTPESRDADAARTQKTLEEMLSPRPQKRND